MEEMKIPDEVLLLLLHRLHRAPTLLHFQTKITLLSALRWTFQGFIYLHYMLKIARQGKEAMLYLHDFFSNIITYSFIDGHFVFFYHLSYII